MPKFMNLPHILAADASTTVQFSDWASVITSVTSQFSVANIVAVVSGTIAAGIGFIFLWWGVRKGYRFLRAAVKNGRGSV